MWFGSSPSMYHEISGLTRGRKEPLILWKVPNRADGRGAVHEARRRSPRFARPRAESLSGPERLSVRHDYRAIHAERAWNAVTGRVVVLSVDTRLTWRTRTTPRCGWPTRGFPRTDRFDFWAMTKGKHEVCRPYLNCGGAPGRGGNACRVGVPMKHATEYGKSRVRT